MITTNLSELIHTTVDYLKARTKLKSETCLTTEIPQPHKSCLPFSQPADSRSMKEELQQLPNKQNDNRNDDDNTHDKNGEGNLNNNDNKDEDNNANHNADDNTAHANGTAKAKKRNRPLSKEIMAFHMLMNFTLPTTLKAYDGIGDPNVYITKFENMMLLNGTSDPILCHSFPSFLDGVALLWFPSLPAGSISSLQELVDLFKTTSQPLLSTNMTRTT
ncbi:hypothetical protein PIB30_085794 [Stylosanthes scabra]|uniref:Uncharacterized protein n=1 Tax=Stylosanthes scabra TaxID=79078 RepID=A0ABU6RT93_9FABA|nr:hypothetical protein [Stylosanthes scabra]